MLMKVRLDLADEDTNGLASALTGVGPWTPDEATATPDGLAHQITLTSAANLSAITITIAGTDADGVSISESRAGPNANTVETSAYFKTVTTVTASATLGANTMDVGWADEAVSPSFPLDFSRPSKYFLDVTGTISLDIDYCRGPFNMGAPQSSQNWAVKSTSLDDETADSADEVEIGYGPTAWRARINSYSATAEVTVHAVQAEK